MVALVLRRPLSPSEAAKIEIYMSMKEID